jgi:hypothetical protein
MIPRYQISVFLLHCHKESASRVLLSFFETCWMRIDRHVASPVASYAMQVRDDYRHYVLFSIAQPNTVYVSAQFVLCEEFPGKRTDSLLSRAQDCFSNLWPYLIFRRQEKAKLKRLYDTSFLSRFAPNPMSERLWGNPDTGDEISSALRCSCITRRLEGF